MQQQEQGPGFGQQGYQQQQGGYGGQEQQYGESPQHQGYNEPGGGAYSNQPSQGMGNNAYAQGAGGQQQQQMGGAPDNRDTMTKWLDKIEKKFGGERFNNPENAEKNRKMNESILKRLKQVAKLAMKKGPGMVMRMAR